MSLTSPRRANEKDAGKLTDSIRGRRGPMRKGIAKEVGEFKCVQKVLSFSRQLANPMASAVFQSGLGIDEILRPDPIKQHSSNN